MFFSPEQIVKRYPQIAAHKARSTPAATFARATLAGIFIALAVFGAHVVGTLFEHAGTAKLVASLLFPCGLAMVLLIGCELFTGNNMLVIALGRGRLSVRDVAQNWLLVYFGNLAGSLCIAALVAYVRQADAAFIEVAIHTAEAKAALTVPEAFVRAVLCNILVCGAVWMSYSTESAAGKIAAMYFPVVLFVLCGTEHCVTNMMYFPVALWLGGAPSLSWSGFLLNNLLPVTLGNILGGALVVGGLLTLSFREALRGGRETEAKP